MSDRTYNDSDVSKLVRRFSGRTVDERLSILRALLCEVARDMSPTYEGVDPVTGPFQGPPIADYMIELACYFRTSADTAIGEIPSEATTAKIKTLARDGIATACEHARYSFARNPK